LSKKVNRIVSIPYKHIWFQYGDVLKLLKKTKHVLIVDVALNDIDDSFLNLLVKKGAVVDLYLMNSMDASSPMFLNVRNRLSNGLWHKIYTFDPVDAKKYGFDYSGFNYYSKNECVANSFETKYDAYFVGGIKGNREGLINSVYEKIVGDNGIAYFNVMVYKGQNINYHSGINYVFENWAPYEGVLKAVLESKCVVEILQDGQFGASLRYFEAVCFNKKLITNNPYIKTFPFYDERFMRVFETAEDIDVEWMKKEEFVDYHYDGSFSPRNLLKLGNF
jgi:hypothetical protein